MTNPILDRAVSRVARRLIWFLIILYLFAVLDRVNVSFAAVSMNKALGLSAEMFGFGATMFLIGYVLMEVPSNVLLERTGARVWLARIGLTWGLATAAMILVNGPISFFLVRFLIGAAEAGCLPGILYFMTHWFPQTNRAKFNSLFFLSIPITNAISAPFSAAVLQLDGWLGLPGWKWLFLIEGGFTCAIGITAYFYLENQPADAKWLPAPEKDALQRVLDEERRSQEGGRGHVGIWKALTDPLVLALAVAYTGINIQLNTAAFWFPQIFKSFGLTNAEIGLATAAPFVCGSIAMVLWGRRSDRAGERIFHTCAPIVVSSLGWGLSAAADSAPLMLAGLALASMGFFSAMTVFWTLPSRLMTGAGAAAAIALISAMGNLGSAAGAPIVGRLHDIRGGWSMSLAFVAGYVLIAPAILLVLRRRLETNVAPRSPAGVETA